MNMYGDEIKEEDIVNKILCTMIEAYASAADGRHDQSSRRKSK